MKRVLMALACLVFAAAAFGQMPTPDPKMKDLKVFIGSWNCKGDLFTSDEFGPGHPVVASIKVSTVLGGFFLEAQWVEKKTTKSPYPYDDKFFFGYDVGSKMFTLISLDNTGSSESASSSGWNVDEMIFEGPVHGGPAVLTSRDTFEKGKNKMHHTFSLQQKDGSWKKIEEDRCTLAK